METVSVGISELVKDLVILEVQFSPRCSSLS